MTDLRTTYEWLHRNHEGYGATNHGRNALPLAAGCASVLDVGGGFTPFACHAADMHLMDRAAVLDISEVPRETQESMDVEFFQGEAHDLPFADNEFELVTAFDVLEHLLPENLDKAISEILRVASRRVIISVGTRSNVKKVDGVDMELHLSKMSLVEWRDKLRDMAGNAEIKPADHFYYIVSEIVQDA